MDYVQFRTAFRGFHKEDVVTFIDRFTKEKEQKIAALKEENDQLRNMLIRSSRKPEEAAGEEKSESAIDAPISLPQEAASDEKAEQLQVKLDELTEKINALQCEKDALYAQKESLCAQLSEITEKNEALVAEKQELSRRLEEKSAAQPESCTERELAAYRRAEETERLARERAARIYKEIDEALNNGSRQSEIDTNELMRIAQSVNEDVARLQQKVGDFRENYRSIGQVLREVGEKP